MCTTHMCLFLLRAVCTQLNSLGWKWTDQQKRNAIECERTLHDDNNKIMTAQMAKQQIESAGIYLLLLVFSFVCCRCRYTLCSGHKLFTHTRTHTHTRRIHVYQITCSWHLLNGRVRSRSSVFVHLFECTWALSVCFVVAVFVCARYVPIQYILYQNIRMDTTTWSHFSAMMMMIVLCKSNQTLRAQSISHRGAETRMKRAQKKNKIAHANCLLSLNGYRIITNIIIQSTQR